MKKLLLILCLLLTLCLLLAACDEGKNDAPDTAPDEGTEQPGDTPEAPDEGEEPETPGGDDPVSPENPGDPELCAHTEYGTDNKCKVCGTLMEYTDGLEYTLNGDGSGYSVAKGSASQATKIIIPYYYEEKPITNIGSFFNCANLTTIVIPEGVKSIDESAFYCCAKLSDVAIPNTVTTIGAMAFFSARTLLQLHSLKA